MRSPKWNPEEAKLVLLLYLKKGYEWQSAITDKTPEIVSISNILKGLDFVQSEHPDNFRSPSSIRLKLANFKALDPKYKKQSMANISSGDKEIWSSFSGNIVGLTTDCTEIIKNHLNDKTKKKEKEFIEYLSKYDDSMDTVIKADDIKKVIGYLKIRKINKKSNIDYDLLIDGMEDILLEVQSSENDFQPHAGVNLKPIKTKKNKKQREKHNGTAENEQQEEKIGKYVQNTLMQLIAENKVSENLLHNLQEIDYCRNCFHIGHPLFIKVDPNKKIKDQLIDQNGFVRYWVKPVILYGESYCVCKEWYESNRKHYDKWLENLRDENKLDIDAEKLCQIVTFIQKIDSDKVYVKRNDISKKYGEASEKVISFLINNGILKKYQDGGNALVVEDYDILFDMIEEPAKYCK